MGMYKKLFLLLALAVTAFSVSYGAVAEAWPVFGRNANIGYFLGNPDNDGDFVWRPYVWPNSNPTPGCSGDGVNAIPNSVNTKSEFITFVKCKLNSTADNSHVRKQDRVGAAFIIQTMRGLTGQQAGCSVTNCRPTNTEIADWEARINNPQVTLSNTSYSYTVNSYYQGNPIDGNSSPNDNAFYNNSGTQSSLIFSAGSSGTTYVIRRPCANPVSTGSLPEPQTFNMTGRSTISTTEVLPGDTIDFNHYLRNSGPDNTSPTTINYSIRDTVSGTVVLTGNGGTFSNGQEKLVRSHTVTVPATAAPGSQICRRIEWNPDTQSGGSGTGTTRCAVVQYDYDLTPTINVVIRDTSGNDVTSEGVAEPGYTIEFTYSVNNSGLTESETVTCTYNQDTHGGYNTTAPTQVFTPSGANCGARTFPRNSTTTATESVSGAAVTINSTICRSFMVAPATQDGGSASVQSCIPVVAKPYSRVYGGDVAVGSGFGDSSGGSCVVNNNAAVVGWNRRGGGSNNWAGAGSQYAVYAMSVIHDFAAAAGPTSGGGRAPAPTGLTFANTGVGGNSTQGLFGGHFGSAPCMPDYYGSKPANTTELGGSVNLTDLGSGSYNRSGSLTLTSPDGMTPMRVSAGEEISIYVDGDLHIANSIQYDGTWSVNQIPITRLIVRGNIYINSQAFRAEGLYVAQPNENGEGGIIYTCVDPANPFTPLPLDDDLYQKCVRQYTSRASFVAKEVRLMRTHGSLSQANRSDDAPTAANDASSTLPYGELFMYNPALWIRQPQDISGGAGDYDSIVSLPPIL